MTVNDTLTTAPGIPLALFFNNDTIPIKQPLYRPSSEQPFVFGKGMRYELRGHTETEYTEIVEVARGVHMIIAETTLLDEETSLTTIGDDRVLFLFRSCGKSTQIIDNSLRVDTIGPDCCGIVIPEGVVRTEVFEEQTKCISVKITYRPQEAEPIFDLPMHSLPTPFKRFLSGGPAELCSFSFPMSPRMMSCIEHIISCPYTGMTKVIYYKTKAIELMCDLFHNLACRDRAIASTRSISVTDRQKLMDARKIIHSQLHNPPTLYKLARSTGLNTKKLKIGFKQLFGSPVYQYSMELRLNKAWEMLSAGSINISEVADRLGYKHSQNFSVAFKKRFGISPKEVRSKISSA